MGVVELEGGRECREVDHARGAVPALDATFGDRVAAVKVLPSVRPEERVIDQEGLVRLAVEREPLIEDTEPAHAHGGSRRVAPQLLRLTNWKLSRSQSAECMPF